MKAARLRAAVRHRASPSTGCMFHTKSHCSSIAAVPATEPARFDKGQRPSAIDEVLARRAKSGKLVAGVAAASDSDMFKGPVSSFCPGCG